MVSPRVIVPTVHQTRAEALAAAANHMTYHGGHLLTNVEVYTIFWGSGWATLGNVVQAMNSFFDYVLTSPLMDLLAEYSVSGQHVGYGRRVGTTTITGSNPGDGKTVSDDQIRAALRGWIAAQTIPHPTGNTLFFVYLPPGVSSTMAGDASCTGYCGYHNADGNTFYAVEPYIDCDGCNFTGGDVISNLTKVSSHELCEAITDADLNGWSDDNTFNEIGDVCNDFSDVHQLGGFFVQSEWSNAQGTCALAPTRVLQDFYRAPDNTLRYDWRDSSGAWRGEKTIGGALAGDPRAAALPGTSLLQVFYRAPDNTLRSYWRDSGGSWHGEQTIGGALAGDPYGVALPGTSVLQVFYRAPDGTLRTYWRDPSGSWQGERTIGGALAGDPYATALPGTSVLQVFYRAPDNTLRSYWRDSAGNWHGEQSIGGALAGDPYAAALPGTSVLQVFYRAPDNTLRSYWRDSGGNWHGEQTIGGALGGDPRASVVPGTGMLQVFYRAPDNTLRTYWRDASGIWRGERTIGGVLAGDPRVVTVPGTSILQVFYRAPDNTLRSYWRDSGGNWHGEQTIGGTLAGDPDAAVVP